MNRIRPLALRNLPPRGGDSEDTSVGHGKTEGRKPMCGSAQEGHLIQPEALEKVSGRL